MNVLHSLIRESILYVIELGDNITEATKNIYCVKDECAFDYSTIIRWSKKFRYVCKNLDDRAKSVRPRRLCSKP